MAQPLDPADESASDNAGVFSDQLEGWLGADGEKTIGSLSEVFAEKAFAVTILMLMFIPALPLPTGGISHVVEILTVLLALELIIGRRTLWMPSKFASRNLGQSMTGKAVPFMVRRIRFFERYSKPRGAALYANRAFLSFTGLLLAILAIGALLAPPFSGLDTLPALGVVVIALSMILEDLAVYLVGTLIGAGGLLLTWTLGSVIFSFLKGLFH